MKKIIIMIVKILLSLSVIVFVLFFLIYFYQEKLLFHPTKLDKNYQFDFNTNFEELFFTMEDGVKINTLLFKSTEKKGLVFYLHGNADALNNWGKIYDIYNKLGYDLLLIDYRGYGKSEGNIAGEQQLLDDMQFIYNKMINDIGYEKIIILGYSLGSGPATIMASNNKPEQLILLTPYYSIAYVAKSHYPLVPEFLLRYKFESYKHIKNIYCPITIFHGTNDRTIPLINSKKLIKKCKPSDKLVILDNQTHGGVNYNPIFQKYLSKILN